MSAKCVVFVEIFVVIIEPSIPSLQGSTFPGFTRLCKGLAVILIAGFVLLQVLPSALAYLALIPARTIPFAWNLITAGYIEQSLPGVVVSTIGLLFCGKFLEPLWGAKEFVKFIFVVNLLTSVAVFVTAIALYYITTEERYLYTPISGFYGVLAGFLVGIKQIMPDQELLKIKAKRVPSLVILFTVAISFFVAESLSYLPTLLSGFYMSWIYLRYFQKYPETSLKGDPSDEFSFSSFFPEFLRPIIDPIASIFDKIFCGRRSEGSVESRGYTMGDTPLPGSDPIEATRRRERGARALEQRLAAEKLSGTRSSEGVLGEDATANV
ncbi:Rhomboid-like protein 19 [Ananas comosus]|uniref:Rhomboid-like protein 19 n=1 Tax=Ananas comosus TaxID=4615 RepID=A0A199V3G7_ANACO|nr:Rhomboid-like protein 19 [Ananas comosus]